MDLLRESRVHGDILFPLGYYSMHFPDDRIILDCHWHHELEFLMITEGTANIRIGTTEYEVGCGEAVFIHSGEVHSGYSAKNTCSFSAIVFHPTLLNSNACDQIQCEYINAIFEGNRLFPIHIKNKEPWEKELLCYLEKIIELADEKRYTYEMLIKSHLYCIFALMLQNSKMTDKKGASDKNKNQLKDVIQYIQSNYQRAIRIRQLSSIANMSEGHFCRFFKKNVMKTPIEYLNYYRIMKASILLKTTDRKVIDIAMDVGFSNISYFIDRFKKHMVCTPAQYRKSESQKA